MTRSSTLKGRHVLAALLCFFGVVMLANAVFLTYAIRSFPGQEVEKSYLQGLRFNDEIEARKTQATLGWSAVLTEARLMDGQAMIAVTFHGRGGAALFGLIVEGELRRPAASDDDHKITFNALGGGAYRSGAVGVAPGAYDLSVTARSPEGEVFKLEKRLFLK